MILLNYHKENRKSVIYAFNRIQEMFISMKIQSMVVKIVIQSDLLSLSNVKSPESHDFHRSRWITIIKAQLAWQW